MDKSKRRITATHVKFLHFYLDSKNEKTFLNGTQSYLLSSPRKCGYATARVGGSKLKKRFSIIIRDFKNKLAKYNSGMLK